MLLLAFSIKAAVFPLSFWLPDSYPTAPAPVTAVFAGLLTKVGVYAMIRTETQIFRDNDVNTLLLVVALATMIVGVLGALAQAELKRILSFTLVSHVGYLVFGLAIATPVALGATIYYMVHHIIVQTTLFLAVGLVERRAGSTSILKVKGLMRRRPSSRCCTSSRRSTSAGCRRSRASSASSRCSTRRRRSARRSCTCSSSAASSRRC
jgi:multicomponent Na+:H+ antiporter subunit D